ncbi:hypothetical protein ACJ41O_010020 [Fusarium nematophilum]
MPAACSPSDSHSPMLSFKALFLAYFTLLLALAHPGLAAHVQNRDCIPRLAASGEALSKHPRFNPGSLSASLDERANETRLELRITSQYLDPRSCEQQLAQNISLGLTLAALGGTRHYHGDIINSTCQTRRWPGQDAIYHMQDLHVLFRIHHPAPLTAFELQVDLRGSDDLPFGCLEGFLTPDVGPAMQSFSLWGPAITLIMVILAAGWREWSNLVQRVGDEEEGSGNRGSGRAHLTRIADCLSYIQFIFFAGALSLNYPGFLQPMVSSVSWSALMLQQGIVVRDSLYHGIRDGIHEINGTFGGTSGLEHMTQVMGAPVTMFTWTNIVTLALVILVCLYIVIQVGLNLRWTRDWFRGAGRWALESSSRDHHKTAIWAALRVFLSYFLLPLTAWTTYQLDHARILPVYYTILTAVVVCILLGACWWGLSLRSPQSMGYLLIDDLHEQEPDEAPSRSQDYYTLATFAFLLARGAAIGGLQQFGTEQLLVLLACEVAQVGLAIWAWSVSGMLSRSTVVTCARLFVLLLCLGMVPHMASHQAASALGYSILVFHALFLAGMFLVPSAYELAQFALARADKIETAPEQPDNDERPQIYGLRQLSRRPTTTTNLSLRGLVDHDRSSSLGSKPMSPNSPRGLSLGSEPVSPEHLRTYFRSPRPERSSMNLRDRDHRFEPLGRSSPDSESASSSQSDSGGDLEAASPAWQLASPSNPNVDYSFREADLYYVKPRRVSFRQTSPSNSDGSDRGASLVTKLRFWSR